MKDLRLKKVFLIILYTIALVFLFVHLADVWSILSSILKVLTPVIIGFVIAYILNFPYKLFYEKILGKMGEKRKVFRKFRKPLSMICVYLIVFGIVTVSVIVLIPNITHSVKSFVGDVPKYAVKVSMWLMTQIKMVDNTFGTSFSSMKDVRQIIESITGAKISTLVSDVASWAFPTAYSTLLTTATGLYNVILGIIISIYMLAGKNELIESFVRFFKAFLSEKIYNKLKKVIIVTDVKCGRYIVGKFKEILIMGVLYFAVFGIINFHYSSLIAFIMTISGFIPFFGPFIGGIPSALILLIVNPVECLWFVITLILLQQFDGNILGPRVLGQSVGLSGFWVLLSVVVCGGLFGILGMLLGVPVVAVIYTLVNDAVDTRFKKRVLTNKVE